MELYELIFIALLGASFGSFANVLIYRIPLGISIIKPNSFCPNCKSKIKFYHNIPIISWILLKQKCANCGTKITFSYPLVEILSTILIFIISSVVLWLVLAIMTPVWELSSLIG